MASLDAEIVAGDLRRPRSLARAVAGVDTVIHLGARAAFESYRRLRPTIVEGTRALALAAAEAGVERFVFASSVLVYGDQSGSIDARTPARPAIDYGRAKLEAERVLEEIAAPVSMRVASIRLPHVYGARDLIFERLRSGRFPIVGSGRNRYAHLHVEDAARLLLEVARRGWRGRLPVGDDEPASWNEFFTVLAEHFPRFRVHRVPRPLANLGAGVAELLLGWRRRPNLYTRDAATAWSLSLPVAPGLLWEELGLEPRYPTIHQGLPAALDDSVAYRWRHPLADPVAWTLARQAPAGASPAPTAALAARE